MVLDCLFFSMAELISFISACKVSSSTNFWPVSTFFAGFPSTYVVN